MGIVCVYEGMCVLVHISVRVPLGVGPPESRATGDCEPFDDTWDLLSTFTGKLGSIKQRPYF